jgi:iron complex outermembrane receptor protein
VGADKHWKFDGSVSVLHGTITSNTVGLDANNATAAQNAAGYPGYFYYFNMTGAAARATAEVDLKGRQVPGMPTLQGSVAAAYTNRVGPGDLTRGCNISIAAAFRHESSTRAMTRSRLTIRSI